MAPNPLPPLSLALLKEGYVLFVTVASMLMIYVIGLVFARRIDKSDKDKVNIFTTLDSHVAKNATSVSKEGIKLELELPAHW